METSHRYKLAKSQEQIFNAELNISYTKINNSRI